MAAPGGILALLASKPKSKGGAEKSEPLESEGGGELESSLRDMFDALKSGDDSGAALAFKRAMTCCEDEHAEPDEDEFGGPSDEDMDD